MEEANEPRGSERAEPYRASIRIGDGQVMRSAIGVTSVLGDKKAVALKASGKSIPNAVAVALSRTIC